MDTILKVRGLAKKYKDFTVVDHVSFDICEGEIVGLVGPNGAGKTTIIQMLLSLIEPTEGSIEIFGKNLLRKREDILANMNFAAPYASLPHNLTPYENLVIFALVYGIRNYKEKVETLLRDFRLIKLRNNRTGGLSSGEQTRLGIAKAFLNDPKFLLLDEPTASLDPAIARELRIKICQRIKNAGGAILWTSQNMREIEQICNRIIFLAPGKIIADDTPANIKEHFRNNDLEEIFVNIAKNLGR